MKATRNPRPRWIVSAFRVKTSSSYTHLHLCFRLAVKIDAATQAADALRRGSDTDYYTERAAKLRAETGSTVAYDSRRGTSFELRWQASSDGRDAFGGLCKPSEWYGVGVAEADLSADAGRAIAKLSKAYGLTPEQAIAELKATPTEYNDCGLWAAAEVDISSPLDVAMADAPAVAANG